MALFGEKYDKAGARAVDGRFLHGAVRRHARDAHRRHRPVPDRQRNRRRRRRAPHRGGHRPGGARLRRADRALLADIAQLVHGSREDAADKVREALERIRALEKENRALKDKLALGQGTDLAAGAVEVDGVKVLATRVDGADAGALRSAVDQLKSRLGSAIVVLGSVESDSKVVLVAGVTPDQTGAREGRGTYRRRRRPSGRQGRRSRRLCAGRRQQAAGARRGAGQRRAVGASAPGGTLMKFNVLLQRYRARLFAPGTVVQRGSNLPAAPSAVIRSGSARCKIARECVEYGGSLKCLS